MNDKYAKAIHSKCLECSGDSPKEVEKCDIKSCPLWKYRNGEVNQTHDKTGQEHRPH